MGASTNLRCLVGDGGAEYAKVARIEKRLSRSVIEVYQCGSGSFGKVEENERTQAVFRS